MGQLHKIQFQLQVDCHLLIFVQGAGSSATRVKVLSTGKSTTTGDLSLRVLDKADISGIEKCG